MQDILTALAKQDSKPKAPKPYNVVRYQISCNGKWSRKYYTRRQAQRLVKRATRMGADAYMSSLSITEWR